MAPVVRLTDSMNPTTGAQIQTQFVQVEREREREVAHSSTMVQQMAQPRIIPQWEIEWNQYGKLQKSWWKKYNGAVNLEIWIRNQG